VTPNTAAIIIGDNTGDVGMGELTLRTLGYLNLAKYAYGIEMGTFMSSGSIVIGNNSTPIVGPYVCTEPMHLVNKQYVDSILSSTEIEGNTLTASSEDATVDVYTNLTSGTINIGSDAMTGNININTGGQLNLGDTSARVNVGYQSSEIWVGAAMPMGSIKMGYDLTSGDIEIGNPTVGELARSTTGELTRSTVNTHTTNLNGATVNVGNSSATVNLGVSSADVNIATASSSGALNIGTDTDTTQTTTLNGATVNVGTGVTDGGINIGTGMTTSELLFGNDEVFTGAITMRTLGVANVGPYASGVWIGRDSPFIHVGTQENGSATPSGTINLGAMTDPTELEPTGTTQTVNIQGATVNVGTKGSNVVNIGSEESTLNLSGPIHITNTFVYPIVNTNCIGFEIYHEFELEGEFEPQRAVVDTITLPHSGVYIFNSMVYYEFSGAPYSSFIVLNGQGTYDLGSIFSAINTAATACMTQVVTATASEYTLTLMVENCVHNARGYFKAVRIA
jgi:hypothetical protein